jgi:ABC-2 type transport system ATP-binding protein
VRTYSHGMRQRLALAQALLPEPKCLLLDEPTDGLDPEGIHEFRSTILKLRREQGLTILLNSHLLSEVEQMCDRCVILREGKKVYEGSVKAGEEELPRYTLKTPDKDLAQQIAMQCGARFTQDTMTLAKDGTGPEFLARLVRAGVRVEAWTPLFKTLEDWYLELSQGGRP